MCQSDIVLHSFLSMLWVRDKFLINYHTANNVFQPSLPQTLPLRDVVKAWWEDLPHTWQDTSVVKDKNNGFSVYIHIHIFI